MEQKPTAWGWLATMQFVAGCVCAALLYASGDASIGAALAIVVASLNAASVCLVHGRCDIAHRRIDYLRKALRLD